MHIRSNMLQHNVIRIWQLSVMSFNCNTDPKFGTFFSAHPVYYGKVTSHVTLPSVRLIPADDAKSGRCLSQNADWRCGETLGLSDTSQLKGKQPVYCSLFTLVLNLAQSSTSLRKIKPLKSLRISFHRLPARVAQCEERWRIRPKFTSYHLVHQHSCKLLPVTCVYLWGVDIGDSLHSAVSLVPTNWTQL